MILVIDIANDVCVVMPIYKTFLRICATDKNLRISKRKRLLNLNCVTLTCSKSKFVVWVIWHASCDSTSKLAYLVQTTDFRYISVNQCMLKQKKSQITLFILCVVMTKMCIDKDKRNRTNTHRKTNVCKKNKKTNEEEKRERATKEPKRTK